MSQTEKEKDILDSFIAGRPLSGAETMAIVTYDLQFFLSPQRLAEVQMYGGIAGRMLDILRSNPNYNHTPDPLMQWEKATLMFGLAKELQQAVDAGDEEWKEGIATLAHFVYAEELMHRQKMGHRLKAISKLIGRAWPESKGDIGWAKQYKAVDGIVTFPFPRDSEAVDIIYTANREAGIPAFDFSDTSFQALAHHDEKVAFVFNDTSEHQKEHERLHIAYPGLRIGFLGLSLDEGMTDMCARIALTGKVGLITPFSDSYSYEILLLQKLFKKDPQLRLVIEERYKSFSPKSTVLLAARLIDRFGLSGYLDLYRAHHIDVTLEWFRTPAYTSMPSYLLTTREAMKELNI